MFVCGAYVCLSVCMCVCGVYVCFSVCMYVWCNMCVVCVCGVCVCLCIDECRCLKRPGGDIGSPGVGMIGGCGPLGVGARN